MNPNPSFEERDLIDSEGRKQTFLVHLIRSPEDWLPADQFSGHYDLPNLGTNKVMRFDLKGVSLAEWEAMESEHTVPRWMGEGNPDADHEQRVTAAINAKKAAVFEISTGKKIPGDTMAEKAAFLKRLNEGESDALYYYIQNQVCNFQDGQLLNQYLRLSSLQTKEVTKFEDFESWNTAVKSEYFFRMHRSTEECLTEFLLKSLDADARLQIESETRDPQVPQVPKRDKTSKKLVRGEWEPNYEDAGYKKAVRAVSQKRLVLYFQSCLPFELPGTNALEKYEWISQRLAGDVVRLRRFIESELLSYESRYNVFTTL